MRITLCSSSKFFDKLLGIKEELENLGYEVFLPSMKDFHHREEDALAKIQYNLIREHFKKIEKSDAIYVYNEDKNGIEGYIGGNTLLEIGKAFDREIPIFLCKDFSRELSYKEELLAMDLKVIGLEWKKLKIKKDCGKIKEYQEACKRSAKKFDTLKEEILTWGLGIAGEAGDVASCIKKTFAHDNDQRVGIRENIGDTLWYIAMICNYFGWSLDEILDENLEKLQNRYPQGFNSEDASRGGTMIDWNKK